MMRAIVLLLVLLCVSGCTFIVGSDKDYKVSVKEAEEQVFADCDSFLAYFDSCERFYASIPGSVCEQRYGLAADSIRSVSDDDIPSSDAECHPLVECNWFNGLSRTASRLSECRVSGPARPRCIISYDIRCLDFNATKDAVMLRIGNDMGSNANKLDVSLVTYGGVRVPCFDSRDDRTLSAGENETFICKAKDGFVPLPRTRTLKASIDMVYEDGNRTVVTKTGVLEVEV